MSNNLIVERNEETGNWDLIFYQSKGFESLNEVKMAIPADVFKDLLKNGFIEEDVKDDVVYYNVVLS